MVCKKSQAQQAFAYIFAILVIGALVVFGFRSIGGILDRGCDAEYITFKKDVELRVVPVGDGSYQKVSLGAPCDVVKLCFVDRKYFDEPPADSHNFVSTGVEQIASSVKAGVQNNVFVVGDTVEPIGYNDYIILDSVDYANAPLCVDASFGKFDFGLRGVGRNVQIEQLN